MLIEVPVRQISIGNGSKAYEQMGERVLETAGPGQNSYSSPRSVSRLHY